jgi:hypothetical protein
VLAGQHQAELGLVQRRGERLDGGLELGLDVLTLARQLGEDLGFLDLVFEGPMGVDRLGETGALFQELLGARLVLVEIGTRRLRLQLLEAARRCDPLKDDLGARCSGCAGFPPGGRARLFRNCGPS